MEPGYRESTESWAGVLRDLQAWDFQALLVAVGDGVLGLWAALEQVFPTTEHQRCWNHRVLNVQAKLPKRLQPEARQRLHRMAYADTQAACEELRDWYVADPADRRPTLGRCDGAPGLGGFRHLLPLSQRALGPP